MIRQLAAEVHGRDPLLSTIAWLHLALFALMLLAMPFDDRTVTGLSPWIKPAKFAVSIAIYLWTVAWLLRHVRDARMSATVISRGIATAMTVEILCIALQAARGTTSHYNVATGFDAVVFNTMGIGILVNTALAGWLLGLYLRRVPLPLAYLWGIRLGLLVFVLGSLEGAAMLLRGAHTVGAPDGGAGLPFVNWSTQAGDLRVAHALGLHAIQVLPLAGHLTSRRLAATSAARQLTVLVLFAAAYGGLGAYLFWTAIHGRPVIPL